jgi:hypothetical protein
MLMDMHIHTRFSPCSVIRVRQLISVVRQKGLDGVCITDHDTAASLSVLKHASEFSGFCVIVGMEYTTSKGDFLVFGPVEHTPSGMDAEGLMRWAKKEGAITIPAHPFRRTRPAHADILSKSTIVEVMNGRNRSHENELCQRWIEEQRTAIKATGGSDAHTLDEVGKVVTVFKKNIYDTEGLINALHNNDYSPRQRP